MAPVDALWAPVGWWRVLVLTLAVTCSLATACNSSDRSASGPTPGSASDTAQPSSSTHTASGSRQPTPSPSAVTTAPQLSGERLYSGQTHCASCGTLTTAAACRDTTPSTFTFKADGIADGPFSGSFVANGTVTVSNQPVGQYSLEALELTSVAASFTITSPSAQVQGTLSMTGGWGSCHTYADDLVGNSGRRGTGYFLLAETVSGYTPAYTAYIVSRGGVTLDTGMIGFGVTDLKVTPESGPVIVTDANFLDIAFNTTDHRSLPASPARLNGAARSGQPAIDSTIGLRRHPSDPG
jgi:hypothetical protein